MFRIEQHKETPEGLAASKAHNKQADAAGNAVAEVVTLDTAPDVKTKVDPKGVTQSETLVADNAKPAQQPAQPDANASTEDQSAAAKKEADAQELLTKNEAVEGRGTNAAA